MQTNIPLTLGTVELIAVVEFRVTDKGAPPSGPTYACGGEPGWGPEFQIDALCLAPSVGDAGAPFLPPAWLRERLETDILDICRDHLESAARVAGEL